MQDSLEYQEMHSMQVSALFDPENPFVVDGSEYCNIDVCKCSDGTYFIMCFHHPEAPPAYTCTRKNWQELRHIVRK